MKVTLSATPKEIANFLQALQCEKRGACKGIDFKQLNSKIETKRKGYEAYLGVIYDEDGNIVPNREVMELMKAAGKQPF